MKKIYKYEFKNRFLSYNNPNVPNNSHNFQKDRKALNKIRLYALLEIITTIVSLVGGIAAIVAIIPTLVLSSGVSSSSAILTALEPFIDVLIGFIIIVFIINIIAILQLREGYGILKTLSTDFNSPFTGTTLTLIAIVLFILGIIALVATIVPTIPLIVKHVHIIPSRILPSLVLELIVVVIAGIMIFIGEILYSIVGNFNLSKRYGEEGFKTAAYLFIIAIALSLISSLFQFIGIISAILQIVGIILIHTSAGKVLKRI